jgi:hypothetical protein
MTEPLMLPAWVTLAVICWWLGRHHDAVVDWLLDVLASSRECVVLPSTPSIHRHPSTLDIAPAPIGARRLTLIRSEPAATRPLFDFEAFSDGGGAA